MADLKAAFRAAKEQRGTTTQTPAQIRALRAAKLQQSNAQSQAQAPKPAGCQSKPTAQPKPSPATGKGQAPAGLPADFFQQSDAASSKPASAAAQPPAASHAPRPASQPAASGRGSVHTDAVQGTGPTASVPEGFFADKAADAKARGVKLPDAKDKEDEFQAFQRSIEEDLKQAAEQEANVAEEEAEDREEREDFVQWVRIQRIEELKKRKLPTAGGREGSTSTALQEEDDMADAATVTAEMLGLATSMPDGLGKITLPKRQRLQDTLAMLQPGANDDESSEGEEGAGDDVLLDWRAKNV